MDKQEANDKELNQVSGGGKFRETGLGRRWICRGCTEAIFEDDWKNKKTVEVEYCQKEVEGECPNCGHRQILWDPEN